MLGIARTDWSWSALFADFDNDGYKDLFITNGIKRDMGNMDFEMLMFQDGDEIVYSKDLRSLLYNYPVHYSTNYIFKNNPNGRWQPKMDEWGVNQAINSQGAAYADLNNDGFLDLIVNPTDTPILIYQNNGNPEHNYISIKIKGKNKNSLGLGTKAWIYYDNQIQYAELTNSRGFQSSSQPKLHFGLGTHNIIDSVIVVYPLADYDVLKNVEANQELVLKENEAEFKNYNYAKLANYQLKVIDQTSIVKPIFVHQESNFIDLKRDKLSCRMFSKEGPAIAVGDINGDGLDDFFVGGAAGQTSAVYFQNPNGEFIKQTRPELEIDSHHEDIAALIFDANGNGFNDLYVASGSNEFSIGDERYKDRLYLNDGKGNYTRCSDCLPDIRESSSCIAAYDFNNDGYMDLYIGSRTIPERFGLIPDSYLLQNNKGKFEDVTSSLAPSLGKCGMITDATWSDLDGDGEKELIIAGDWMPITVFKKASTQYKNVSDEINLNSNGWWSSIFITDVNGDGFNDIVAGNWGLNSIYQATKEQPLTLLVNDFDNDGIVDPILCIYLEDTINTFLDREMIGRAMNTYFNKYNTYKSFASTSLEERFSLELYESATKLKTDELNSCTFLNDGKGGFDKIKLPFFCQSGPINQILKGHFSKGHPTELIVVGGTNQHYYNEGHIDALGIKIIRWNSEVNNFENLSIDTKSIELFKFARTSDKIRVNGQELILVGFNDDILKILDFSLN